MFVNTNMDIFSSASPVRTDMAMCATTHWVFKALWVINALEGFSLGF